MSLGYWETLAAGYDGTALTAAARASMLQGATGKKGLATVQPNNWRAGDVIKIWASGRISNVITTPGTARFDLSQGVGGPAAFDTGAITLNVLARTNVPWVLDVTGIVRVDGNAANILWQGTFMSEALLASAASSTGGVSSVPVPWNVAPVVGSNIDATVVNIFDFNFTQTVATGSCQLHNYYIAKITATGY